MMEGGGLQNESTLALPKRPFGRSIADFRIESAATSYGLHPAEERLLDCAARGEPCCIASTLPEEPTPENTVRGPFLRFLLLGGDNDAPVHEKDVELQGAFIDGDIDLEGTQGVRPLALYNCLVNGLLIGLNARLRKLNLSGTQISGIDCDGALIAGHVILREGFRSEGEVRFLGAEINGQLDCSGGRFNNPEGDALNCEGAKIASNVFLRDGFVADGEVDFLGAEIGGQLRCTAGKIANFKGYAFDCYGSPGQG